MKESRLKQTSVRWADGTYDHTRTCIVCGLDICANPVHKDNYKEIISKKSYTNWADETNMEEDVLNGHKSEYSPTGKRKVHLQDDYRAF